MIGLANFLKLISIPAVVVEKSWTERFPNQPDSTTEIVNSLPETASNTNSMKKKRKVLQPRKEKVPLKSKPILSTMRTRSGRKVVPKRFEDSIVDGQEDEDSGENENDEPEFALTRDIQESVNEEDADDPGEKEPEVQREERSAEASNSENRASTSSGNNPHETGNSGETEIVVDDSLRVKLDDLFSVAEAIEKSQQPEFHDISKTTVPLEGTETKKLVRECLICDKQMLGRNALSRHMRNSHPKVFGPYNCPIETCSKVVESGEKMISHMQNQHKSQRAQAIAAGERFPCEQCSIVYTTKSRLNFHLRTKHGLTVGKFKPNYHCSEGDCKEVSFFTAKQFSDHMKEVHHLKPWACLKCDKRFADKQNLQFHELTHKGTKSFVCDICNAGFGNPRQLFTHRSLHLGRRFLCEDCGYRARSAANLRGHIKVKHEGKNFECELCFKKFGSNNNLKNHVSQNTFLNGSIVLKLYVTDAVI